MKILKIVVVCILVAGVLGGGITGIIKLVDDDAFDTKSISSLAFRVGGLDGTGAYMDTNTSIYTKEAFECQGLNVTLDFDNMIEYEIFFYDQNNDFVHTAGKRTNAFVDTEMPFFAKYARIVITPTEDDVVSTLEVNKYAKQINISVNREQGFKNYTDNLYEVEFTGKTLDSTGAVIESTDNPNLTVSKHIDVRCYEEILLFRVSSTSSDLTNVGIYCYSANKAFLKNYLVGNNSVQDFTTSQGYKYYQISLDNFDETTAYIRIAGSIVPYEIYCR